jgi:ABC-type branched-subunit amino acid transport system permease subunit
LSALLKLAKAIDWLNAQVGKYVIWLIFAATIISAVNAIVRKVFDMSSNAYLETQWYLFAWSFLMAAGYTLLHREHVRIDVVVSRFSKRTQTWLDVFGFVLPPVTLYYYLFLMLVVASVVICHRLETSRIGRAWMAIREDEIAAKAMGINTRNMKLLAFGMGATFGGVSGSMFAAFQGFVSPEAFSLMESVMIVAMVVLGGMGHLPGVVLGAVLLAALPEVLRYVAGPLQQMTGGRLDASILRQLLIALAMISIMLLRPRGLWPSREHGKAAPVPAAPPAVPPAAPSSASPAPGTAA